VNTLPGPFELLADRIRHAASGAAFTFLRTDGNFGDALIDHGTKAFFEDLGLPWRTYDMASRSDKIKALAGGVWSPKSLVVYSGGGGWADVCDVALINVQRQMRFSSNVIVLPSTIERTIDPMPPVFVRDRFQSQTALPDAPFCHDMAFYLALIDGDRLLARRVAPDKPLGFVFRTDNEARITGPSAHPDNADISTWGTARTPIERFLRHLDQFEHVVTDRLHAAIGAALLGKQVSLVRNSYFKIEAIFRSSIEGNFPKCRLIEDAEALDLVASSR
jgi:CDP-glycerol glycerophosphotransferase